MVEKPSAGFYSRTTWGKAGWRSASRVARSGGWEAASARRVQPHPRAWGRAWEPQAGTVGRRPALLRKGGRSTFLESRTFGSGGQPPRSGFPPLACGFVCSDPPPFPAPAARSLRPQSEPRLSRSARSNMQSLNITPEQFSRLLRDHNLTREHFIALYGLRPLVYTPELPGRAKLAFVLTGGLIFALALFGNALVVYVVTRSKAMRTVTNIFICSLALSDLLIAFFCIPVTMLQNVSDNWLGGESARFPSSRPSRGPPPHAHAPRSSDS